MQRAGTGMGWRWGSVLSEWGWVQGEAGGADRSVSALIKTPSVAAAPGEETKKERMQVEMFVRGGKRQLEMVLNCKSGLCGQRLRERSVIFALVVTFYARLCY